MRHRHQNHKSVFDVPKVRSAAADSTAHAVGAWLQRWTVGLALLWSVAACSSLPTAASREHESALAVSAEQPLVQTARRSVTAPGTSGVRLLPSGLHALDARLQLIDRARVSLDVQYYVLDNDSSGRLMLARLADAAARGVRVRLLVDDLYTTHTDEVLRAMAALPNVSVRVFNPFCCNRAAGMAGRFAASLGDIYRLNHRMHNKLLVADGAFAITGGRNIADDYFQRGARHHFIDLDALLAGAAVADLSASFDRYWNSPVVWSISSLATDVQRPPATAARFAELTADARGAPALDLPERDPLGQLPCSVEFERGLVVMHLGNAVVIDDPPDKWMRDADQAWKDSLAYQALMKIWTAEREVAITSPYLIPGPLGISAFEALRQRKVQVTVLTNSLAATDEPLVHIGYARYRPRLVDAGVALYELSPSHTTVPEKRLGLFGSSAGRLHAKLAVVDGDKSFIGTMNLDPRSRTQNTELGVFFESPALAKQLSEVIEANRSLGAYRLRRSAAGTLQWHAPSGPDGQASVVHDSEPESTPWLILHNLLLGLLVPEQLL